MAYAIPSGQSIDSFDGIASAQSPNKFINEINFNEIEMLQTVGRGAFGVVQKAKWKNLIVAIKILDNGGKEFFDEVSNLSSVNHKNIIKLYGTTYNKPKRGLVMEYADCGSLYNLLHPVDASDEALIPYTFAHVMSWSLQCARAVNYLHQTNPRAIVHRDLKPPNMLLSDYGRTLKICDFGTATAQHTKMTENKGSPSWMAPEVFEGIQYTEKCDVYSFGIVLWEMLTRKKPFDEIGPPAYRIMWAVHKGTRPPPIQNIPKSLEDVMTRCWQKNDKLRPTFQSIVDYFEIINQFVTGGDEPLFEFASSSDEEEVEEISLYTNSNVLTSKEKVSKNVEDRVRTQPAEPEHALPLNQGLSLLRIANNNPNNMLGVPTTYHEHSGSDHDQPGIPMSNNPAGNTYDSYTFNPIPPLPPYPSPRNVYDPAMMYDNRATGFIPRTSTTTPIVSPQLRTPSPSNPDDPYNNRMLAFQQPRDLSLKMMNNDTGGIDFRLVPQDLMPVTPIKTLPLSVQMYENHMESLKNYIELQNKIKAMKAQKENIIKNIDDIEKEQKRNSKYLEAFLRLQTDKQSLKEYHRNIKATLEQEKAKRNIQISIGQSPNNSK